MRRVDRVLVNSRVIDKDDFYKSTTYDISSWRFGHGFGSELSVEITAPKDSLIEIFCSTY